MERLIERDVLEAISRHLHDEKIIGIRGPRQSGKSTVLEMVKKKLLEEGIPPKDITLLTFEDPAVLDAFMSEPRGMLRGYMAGGSRHIFLLDEIQYDKDAGKHLKLVFDTMKDVKLVITGSSSLDVAQVSKFLVGRILMYELFPLSFGEYLRYKDEMLYRVFKENNSKFRSLLKNGGSVKLNGLFLGEMNKALIEYVTYGGYPDVVKHSAAGERIEILKNIYATYIGKDVATLFGIEDAMKLRKILVMLALQIGSLLNYNGLATETSAYYKELMTYIKVLEETYVISIVRPFHRNLRTELRKNPKAYLIDAGMRNCLINNFNSLDRREDAGHIAENFVFSELSKALEPNQSLHFWRTLAKAEVDFVIWDSMSLVPVEVKFSAIKAPAISRGMNSFISAYNPKIAIVATRDFIGKEKVKSTTVFFMPIAFI